MDSEEYVKPKLLRSYDLKDRSVAESILTGFTILPRNGHIIIADGLAQAVRLYDDEGRHLNTEKLPHFFAPMNVATSGNCTVLLTQRYPQSLACFLDQSSAKLLNCVGTHLSKPVGIAKGEEHQLYVSEHTTKSIHLLDLRGDVNKSVHSFATGLTDRTCFMVKLLTTDRIVLADDQQGCMVAYDVTGKSLWHNNAGAPIRESRVMCGASDGGFYYPENDVDKIRHMSADGATTHTVMDAADGITRPQSVLLNPDGELIVGLGAPQATLLYYRF